MLQYQTEIPNVGMPMPPASAQFRWPTIIFCIYGEKSKVNSKSFIYFNAAQTRALLVSMNNAQIPG
jgi:hypothetical protein